MTVFVGKECSEGMVGSTISEQDQVTRVEGPIFSFLRVRGKSPSIGIANVTHKFEDIQLTLILSTHYLIFGRPNRLPQRHFVCVGGRRETKGRGRIGSLGIELVVFRRQRKTSTHKELEREANVKVCRILDLLDLLWSQGDVQCPQILPQMLDLAAADDGEDKWRLEKVVRNRNYGPSYEKSVLQRMRERCSPAVTPSTPISLPTSSSTRLTFLCSSFRSQFARKTVRPSSPFSRLRSSSASVRILPPARTPHGASASPSERAMGMISRSKERSRTLH